MDSLTPQGQVFTPCKLADFLGDLCVAELRSPRTVLEPAIGHGLLVHKLLERTGPLDVVGVDTDPLMIDLSRRLLSRGCNRLSLINHDFLALENHDFPFGKFDIILSNPPYVSAREISRLDSYLERFSWLDMTRETNLYCFFLLRCLELLDTDGVLTFLIPATFMGATFAAPIRELLATKYSLEGVFHIPLSGAQQVFSNSIISAMVIVVRNSAPPNPFPKVGRIDTWDGLDAIIREIRRQSPNPPLIAKRRVEFLDPVGWGPVLFDIGLERDRLVPLDSLYEVFRGLETGHDAFFTLSSKEVRTWGLSDEEVLPIIPSARTVRDHIFTDDDHRRILEEGHAGYLFAPSHPLSNSARVYIERGEELGVHSRSTPSLRNRWYEVNLGSPYPLLIKRMYRDSVQLILNDSQSHTLTQFIGLRARFGGRSALKALLSYSLTQYGQAAFLAPSLDCGRGLRKLELLGVRNVLVPPLDTFSSDTLGALGSLLDRWLRYRESETILEMEDVFTAMGDRHE